MNLTELFNQFWPWNENRDLKIELSDCRYESDLIDKELTRLQGRYTAKSGALTEATKAVREMRRELSIRVSEAEAKMNKAQVDLIKCEELLTEYQGTANPLEQAVMAITHVEASEKNWFILNEVTTETMKIAPVVLQEVTQSFFNWFNGSIYLQMVNTNGEFRLPDNQQWSTDIATWKKVIDRDPTDRTVYVKDAFDCENYVSTLRDNIAATYKHMWAGLNALHVAWGRYTDDEGNVITHAYGVIFATDGVYVVEAQTDRIRSITDPNLPDKYKVENMIWFE